MINRLVEDLVRFVALAVFCALQTQAALAQQQLPITHTLLLKSELPDTPGQEVIVWDTRYAPAR